MATVTCVLCHLCIVLPVYCVNCVLCHLCIVSPVYCVTCVLCYLYIVAPVASAAGVVNGSHQWLHRCWLLLGRTFTHIHL